MCLQRAPRPSPLLGGGDGCRNTERVLFPLSSLLSPLSDPKRSILLALFVSRFLSCVTNTERVCALLMASWIRRERESGDA